MTEWHKKIVLELRVYCRELQSTEATTEEYYNKFCDTEIDGIKIRDGKHHESLPAQDLIFAFDPAKKDELKKRGLIINETDPFHPECSCVCTKFILHLEPGESSRIWVKAILENCGNVFASIEVIDSALTEVMAI